MDQALREAEKYKAAHPGEEVVIEQITADEWARGVGAGITASGTELDGKHDAGAPDAHLTGGTGASGGFFKGSWSAAFTQASNASLWLIIGGILCVLGGGALAYYWDRTAGLYLAGLGAVFIACGLFPAFALIIVLAAAVVALWPLIKSQIDKHKVEKEKRAAELEARSNAVIAEQNQSALDATVAAIRLQPPEIAVKVEEKLKEQVTGDDMKLINAVAVKASMAVPPA